MKPWKKALGDIRVLGPDLPRFNADVQLVWDHIEKLEKALAEIVRLEENATRHFDDLGMAVVAREALK